MKYRLFTMVNFTLAAGLALLADSNTTGGLLLLAFAVARMLIDGVILLITNTPKKPIS